MSIAYCKSLKTCLKIKLLKIGVIYLDRDSTEHVGAAVITQALVGLLCSLGFQLSFIFWNLSYLL